MPASIPKAILPHLALFELAHALFRAQIRFC